MSTSTCFCVQCKRALDRISILAKNRGEEWVKWLSECRTDPEKVHPLLLNYYGKTGQLPQWSEKLVSEGKPESGARKARGGPKWDMAEFAETLKTGSGLSFEVVGCMMWHRQFVEHCESTAGGRLSNAQAEAKWIELQLQVEEDPASLIWDQRGPMSAPLRVWVKEKDVVKWVQEYMHEKTVTLKDRAVKKVLHHSLHVHDSSCRSSKHRDF
eukprot:6458993-Amphidinium_carterae.1